MKKITILALHLDYGGIEKSIVALANILTEKYQVEIASIYKLNNKVAFELNDKVKVTYLIDSNIAKKLEKYKLLLFKFHFIKLFKALYKDYFKKLKFLTFFKDAFSGITMYSKRAKVMKKFIKNCNSDIIISSRTFLNEWLCQNAQDKVIKIGWEHNHYHNNMKYAIDVIRSAKKLDYFVLVSDNLYQFYKKQLAGYKCKCVFIPNMIDSIPKTLAKLDEKRLISVGRLSKEKGYYDLVRLFNLLSKSHPDWTLDIIGDGPERPILEEYITSHKLKDKITLHGFRDKNYIDKLLHISSIYVMTSYTESFGIVLLEAMSHGLPCIAYDSAEGARELINSGKDGYLIKNRSHTAMIEKIEDLMENKEKRVKLGKEARKNIYNYTSDIVGKKWFELIEESDKNE